MSLVTSTQWGNLVALSMKANQRWLNQVNSDLGVPVGVGAAAVSTLDTTAVDLTDGTMVSNGTNTVTVNLTIATKAGVLTILPSQRNSNILEPANLLRVAQNHGNAIMTAFQDLVITAVAAGTPVIVETLPTGQSNFTTDGTDGEIAQNLRLIGSVVGQCFANHADLQPDDFAIVMDRRAWGHFCALKSTAVVGPMTVNGKDVTFHGIPVYSVASSTYGLGELDKYCAFVTNKRNLAFAYDEPYAQGGGIRPHGDGTDKLITLGTCAYGVIEDDFMGAILNSSS